VSSHHLLAVVIPALPLTLSPIVCFCNGAGLFLGMIRWQSLVLSGLGALGGFLKFLVGVLFLREGIEVALQMGWRCMFWLAESKFS